MQFSQEMEITICRFRVFTKIKYIKEGSIVYTSGVDGIISPAIPVGKIIIKDQIKYVEFFVNFNQLKFIRVNN